MTGYYAAKAQNGAFNNSTGGYEPMDLSVITEAPEYYYAGTEGLLT